MDYIFFSDLLWAMTVKTGFYALIIIKYAFVTLKIHKKKYKISSVKLHYLKKMYNCAYRT